MHISINNKMLSLYFSKLCDIVYWVPRFHKIERKNERETHTKMKHTTKNKSLILVSVVFFGWINLEIYGFYSNARLDTQFYVYNSSDNRSCMHGAVQCKCLTNKNGIRFSSANGFMASSNRNGWFKTWTLQATVVVVSAQPTTTNTDGF